MQLTKVNRLDCSHAKTVFSAKDFPDSPSWRVILASNDIILVCFKCENWCQIELIGEVK